MEKQYIYLKMTKPWGGFNVGDVVRFGLNKGLARIDRGEGIKVPKQPAINDPVQPPQKTVVVETAMVSPDPQKETTDVIPEISEKPVKSKRGRTDQTKS